MEEEVKGGDEGLMEFDMGGGMAAPKKAPPNIGKRPVKKKMIL